MSGPVKVLAKFHWDCGRQGDVEGLFVTDQDQLEAAYGKAIYFGEILGKHSDVSGNLDRQDITIASDDQEFIAKLLDVIGDTDISGYNPLSYVSDEEDEEEYEEEYEEE